MTMGRALARGFLSLGLVAVVAGSASLFAAGQDLVIPSPAPGTYPEPILVTVTVPDGKRLEASVNGAPFAPVSGSILLSAQTGEERTFTVATRLFSLAPGSLPESERAWSWLIDRKPPLPPSLGVESAEGGSWITASLNETGTVRYLMWHPDARSRADGAMQPGERVFMPSRASLVAWAVDKAGNRSAPVSPDRFSIPATTSRFKLTSPVPGIWANKQPLVIDAAPGTEIRYSLDGSDPAVSGLAYDGPVLLDKIGSVTLRVVATSPTGSVQSLSTVYSVLTEGESTIQGFSDSAATVGGGELAEIAIPTGFAWAFGDSAPTSPGGKTIALAAVRGTVRRYPLTLSDGKRLWRFVVESGVPSRARSTDAQPPRDAAATPADTAQDPAIASEAVNVADQDAAIENGGNAPIIAVHDWCFVSIAYKDPLYWSLDGKRWQSYAEPVFVDRSVDSTLYWYSATWKEGVRQTLALPAKPVIAGILSGAVTAEPVFLSASKTPMRLRYSLGSSFYPERPDSGSPELASGLLAEVPSGAQSPFTVRILAEYEGIEQGELATDFVIDRHAPRDPATGLENHPSWSRAPVRFSPIGEDRLEVSIEPPLFSRAGNDWILDGAYGKSVEYTVSVFSVDQAGNRSATKSSRVTVELNAVYVGRAEPSSSSKTPDGSPLSPFESLDDALALVQSGSWRVIARGAIPLDGSVRVVSAVAIDANGASITVAPDASIAVEGGTLAIEGGSIVATRPSDSDTFLLRAGKPKPLIEINHGEFRARGLAVTVSGGDASCAIRAKDSRLTISSANFAIDAGDYAQVFDVTGSSLSLERCSLACAARTASAIVLEGSTATLSSSTITVAPVSIGRAAEAWNSRLSLVGVTFERKAVSRDRQGKDGGTVSGKGMPLDERGTNRDTALWLDAKSGVMAEKDVTIRGFWRARAIGTR